MDRNLEELLTKQEIAEVLYRYCETIDGMDPELGASIFHPEATCDYGAMYNGSARDFMTSSCQPYDHVLERHHQIGNILIQLAGDTAKSNSCITATARLLGKDGALYTRQVWARYLDQWEKREGVWAITARKCNRAWEIRPLGAQDHP